jgi:hypothetical protein
MENRVKSLEVWSKQYKNPHENLQLQTISAQNRMNSSWFVTKFPLERLCSCRDKKNNREQHFLCLSAHSNGEFTENSCSIHPESQRNSFRIHTRFTQNSFSVHPESLPISPHEQNFRISPTKLRWIGSFKRHLQMCLLANTYDLCCRLWFSLSLMLRWGLNGIVDSNLRCLLALEVFLGTLLASSPFSLHNFFTFVFGELLLAFSCRFLPPSMTSTRKSL